MTLTDAVQNIVGNSRNNACKRPAMGGYVFIPLTDADYTEISKTPLTDEGDYYLVFRKRANYNGNPVDFVYQYDASSDAWTAPSTALTLGDELFGEFLADDWQVGRKSDFENARTGTGDEW